VPAGGGRAAAQRKPGLTIEPRIKRRRQEVAERQARARIRRSIWMLVIFACGGGVAWGYISCAGSWITWSTRNRRWVLAVGCSSATARVPVRRSPDPVQGGPRRERFGS